VLWLAVLGSFRWAWHHGGVARGDLTDAEWERIKPLLPVSAIGRLPRSLRAQVDGIAFKFRTGVQWRDLPERYGKWNTVYARFAAWRDDGTFERLFHGVIAQAAERGEIDLSLVSVDSTTVRAHQHASGLVVPGQVLAVEVARLEAKGAKGAAEKQEGNVRPSLLAAAIQSPTRAQRKKIRAERRAGRSASGAKPDWPRDCSDAPEAD
jgi:transposase